MEWLGESLVLSTPRVLVHQHQCFVKLCLFGHHCCTISSFVSQFLCVSFYIFKYEQRSSKVALSLLLLPHFSFFFGLNQYFLDLLL